MENHSEEQFPTITVQLGVRSGEFELQGQVTVSTGPTKTADLLPLAQVLSDAIVSETCRAVEQSGATISCKKGCAACCRQMVVISELEARRIGQIIDEMPEERRREIKARFISALNQLEKAGLLSKLQNPAKLNGDEYSSLARAYFKQQIPCPFLEDECCSIYPDRPITCREYLVSSPAKVCTQSIMENIVQVRIPLPVFNAVARWQIPPDEPLKEHLVPLILAPEWAEAHPDDLSPQPGLELLRELITHLTTRETPNRGDQPSE